MFCLVLGGEMSSAQRWRGVPSLYGWGWRFTSFFLQLRRFAQGYPDRQRRPEMRKSAIVLQNRATSQLLSLGHDNCLQRDLGDHEYLEGCFATTGSHLRSSPASPVAMRSGWCSMRSIAMWLDSNCLPRATAICATLFCIFNASTSRRFAG